METNINNYEKACDDWRLKILDLDSQELIEKLPELQPEGEYLTLYHFGKKFGIHLKTAHVVTMEDLKPASINSRMNIYTLLWFASPSAVFKDKWVPFRELRGASPFTAAFEKHTLLPFSKTFSGRTLELKKAFETLGATKLKHADVGYQINAFACLPMRFLFWDADDEFPAETSILYDISATDFIHVESTVSLAGEGFLRLIEISGIPAEGHVYKL